MLKALRFLTVISLLIFSCNPDKNAKIDLSQLDFKTDDSSKLFFKNIRQPFYEKEEMEAAKLETFRLKKRERSDDFPVINIAIVNNWRYDEAYILLEPNVAAGPTGQLKVKWKKEGQEGEIIFEGGNKMKHLQFASMIYTRILEQCEFQIYLSNKWENLFNTEKTREAFRITMFDYYRLIRQF